MKTRILLVIMAFVFGLSNMIQAQKLSRKKVQITELKNVKVLGTDEKGNVFDNSKLLKEAPEYQAGENVTIDNSNPLKPIINSVSKDYEADIKSINNKIEIVNSALINKVDKTDKSLFVPYTGATKDVELGEKSIRLEKGNASLVLNSDSFNIIGEGNKRIYISDNGFSGNLNFNSKSVFYHWVDFRWSLFRERAIFEKGIILKKVDNLPEKHLKEGAIYYCRGSLFLCTGDDYVEISHLH